MIKIITHLFRCNRRPKCYIIHMRILLTIIAVISLPAVSFAWGFETHISIGLHIVENTGVDIIRQNPAYFICGNIFPDLFNLFKDFSKFKKELPTHSWQTVSRLFNNAESDEELSFAYGYSSHLSADIIAHNHMVPQHIAYVNSGRMRSHLMLEMAEESVHLNKYNTELQRMLRFAPQYGDIFLRTMGISRPWFEREVRAIRMGIVSQKHLKVHKVTAFIKKRVQPNFEERVGYFREAAIIQAYEAVENGFANIQHHDPSGRENMQKARELRTEMLKSTSKKALKDEFHCNIDQKHFPLK